MMTFVLEPQAFCDMLDTANKEGAPHFLVQGATTPGRSLSFEWEVDGGRLIDNQQVLIELHMDGTWNPLLNTTVAEK